MRNLTDVPRAELLRAPGEEELVQLDPDHPGFRDAHYRQRRNDIARRALEHRPGERLPDVAYSEEEQQVWRTVWEHLTPLHGKYACREYHQCSDLVRLSRTRVPQLAEVNAALVEASGFRMLPVAGLVTARGFLGSLGRGVFLATQYMRHPSTPLYTPEPDVVHELVGHAATLAHPGFARLNRAFGEAAGRASEERLRDIGRVYWFTMEFGVVREGGRAKAYGAGLLSSFGELGRFETQATLKPLDLEAMAAHAYDPTCYQDVLYVADSFDSLIRDVTGWLLR